MILYGLVLTLPALVATTLYAKAMGPRIEAMIAKDTGEPLSTEVALAQLDAAVPGHGTTLTAKATADAPTAKEAFDEFKEMAAQREKELPSLVLSMLPIVAPILLIFLNTGVAAYATTNEGVVPEWLVATTTFIGNPVIAVGLGVILAIYGLAQKFSRHDTIALMEKGIDTAGIILLVTGAGGALGAVLRDSGVGEAIGEWVSTLPLPTILIPFLIATMVRLVQGSGTVAIITSASLSAPILAQIPGVNMVLAAQAAALGAMVFSYFNDSLFWVVNRMLGVKEVKHQLLTWSVPTTVAWATSLVTILIADIFV